MTQQNTGENKMKKVKQDNLKVNAVIYREERPSESFEINALQDGVGLTLSISNAIDDYKPIDSSKPTGNFSVIHNMISLFFVKDLSFKTIYK
jgi:hypothetical protein